MDFCTLTRQLAPEPPPQVMLQTKAFATKRAYVMNERKLMRLKYPTIALAYATRNARYKSSKNSQSRTPNIIDRVRYTAAGGARLDNYKGSKNSNSREPDAIDRRVRYNTAGGAGLDSYKSSKNSKSREPDVIDRVRYTAAGSAGLHRYKSSKNSKSREPYAIDRVRYNTAVGAGLDSAIRPPAVTAPAPARRRQLPPNYKSTARKLV